MLTLDKFRSSIISRDRYCRDFKAWFENNKDLPLYRKHVKNRATTPQVSVEKEIIQRVKSAGLGHLIQDIPKLTKQDCQDALDKGKALMETKFISKNKLEHIVTATNIVFASLIRDSSCTKIKPLSLSEATLELNLRSSAGSIYNWNKKALVLDEILSDAKDIYNQERPNWMTYPVGRSFRSSLRPEDYRNPKSRIKNGIRVIYPLQGSITLCETIFVAPIVKIFAKSSTFYSTGKIGSQYSKELRKRFISCNNIIGTDISKFDQTLHHYCQWAAFDALKDLYVMNRKESLLYDNLVKYLSACPIGSKGPLGKVDLFVKERGIVSGTTFTSLIDTLSNAIMIAMICPSAFDFGQIMICGDDVIMQITDNVKKKDIYDIYKSFGMTVRENASYTFKSWNNVFYLGYFWINGNRHLHKKLAINKAIYHTNFIRQLTPYDRIVARTASVFLVAKDGKDLFLKLFPDIAEKLKSETELPYFVLHSFVPGSDLIKSQSSSSLVQASLTKALTSGYLNQ